MLPAAQHNTSPTPPLRAHAVDDDRRNQGKMLDEAQLWVAVQQAATVAILAALKHRQVRLVVCWVIQVVNNINKEVIKVVAARAVQCNRLQQWQLWPP
jgi:hypothetical protein